MNNDFLGRTRLIGCIAFTLSLTACSGSGNDASMPGAGNEGSGGSAFTDPTGSMTMTGSVAGGPTTGTGGLDTSGAGGTGTGGSGGQAGETGLGGSGNVAAGGSGEQPPSECQRGLTSGNEVVLIGDSYLDQPSNSNIQFYLEELARAAGSLGPADAYRRYYLGGTAFSAIVDQWHTANAEGSHRVVIMTGGGNDVLIFNRQCLEAGSSTNPDCQAVILDVTSQASNLMVQMGEAGIEDVIYFFYPNLPGSLLAPATANEMLDYSYPLARESCESATAVDCHFVDTRPAFEGRPELIGFDGIHPTPAGSEVIANLIWDVMVADCIAQ